MSFAHSPKIVTDGLVLALDAGNTKSYVSGSTTWFDKSGRGNNGTLTNGPTFNSDNLGSIVFDGVDDISIHPSTLYVDNFTLSAWVYKTSSGIQTIIAKGNSSFVLNFYLRIAGNSGFYGTNASFSEILIPDLVLNIWNNTVLTYDKTSLKYYLNGVFINQNNATNTPSSTTSNTIVGRLGDFNGQYWTGRIATTQIYNRALSAQEVSQNFNALRGRFGI
jgi:hypothetical protein